MQDPVRIQIYGVEDGIAAAATRQTYHSVFSLFLEHNEVKDSQLLQQHPRSIEDKIINHIRYLSEEKRLTPGSISVAVAAIFHFLEVNDVLLNKRKVTRFIPGDKKSPKDRAYTLQEIQQMLLKCDERSRVIILLMASTGMRIGAIPELQLRDLEKIEASDFKLYRITVYANSKEGSYYCFTTPETAAAIDSYLAYRKRFGDPLKNTSPLIREQFDIKDDFAPKYPRFITRRAVIYAVQEALKRSGIKTKEVMESHGLRKFAITQMIKAKVDFSTREYLVGHKVSRGLDYNYDRTSEEDRLSQYALAIDVLTIDPNQRLKKQVKELETEKTEELKQVKAQLAKVMAERRKLDAQIHEISLSVKQSNETAKQLIIREREQDARLDELVESSRRHVTILRRTNEERIQLGGQQQQLTDD